VRTAAPRTSSPARAWAPSRRRPAAEPRGGLDPFRWLLLAAVALLQVQIRTPFEINVAPSDVLLALALVVGFPRLAFRRGAVSPWHGALLCVFGASIFLSANGELGLTQYAVLNKLVGLLVLTALYMAATSYADDWPRIEEMCRCFAVSVALGNMLMLLLFFVPPLDAIWASAVGSSARYADLRLCGMLLDPNAYGGLLVVAFALHFIGRDDRAPTTTARRVFDGLASLTLMLGIVFTFSRTAWMALAGLCAFGMVRSPSAALKLSVLAAVAVTLGVASGVLSVEMMIQLATREGSVESRLEINENAFRMFAESPVMGGGIGAFVIRHDVIIHNTPIWFLAELGLVGITVIVGFALWFFAKGWTALRRAPLGRRALVAGLIAAHASLVALSMGIEALYQRHWWLVLAMIGAAHHASTNVRSARGRGAPLERRTGSAHEDRLR